MQKRSMSVTGAGFVALALLLAGCGEMNVKKYLPFGGDSATPERSRTPPNSIEYQCAAGKRFYVRLLEDGAAAWLILPEREVRLARLGTGTRYSNGIAVLELNGNEATLTDGAASPFTGCKSAGAQQP